MRPAGEQGFEGLVTLLLSELTGDRFYVARSGDQPADAVSSAGDVVIQAKRYDRTPLNETEFEGEFSRACRECPNLDCYVFATTRPTAQISILCDTLQRLTGVDILCLGFGADDSELPALCVTFWQRLRSFPELSHLGPKFDATAGAAAKRPKVVETVDRLRGVVKESKQLAANVQKRLQHHLHVRFGIESAPPPRGRYSIDLRASVKRVNPGSQLKAWWTQKGTRAAVIIGEEGTGKSWVAAEFALEIIQNLGGLVLWLDSADWAGLPTLQRLVEAGLMHAGFSDQSLRERLAKKALTRWSDRLLIVLDGVNERAAQETTHLLLAQLNAADLLPCRLIFTTRPIAWKADERSLWKSTTAVLIDGFTEAELVEALQLLPIPVPRMELSSSLVEIAKIPRYFRRSIDLRARFMSLSNVSKEMVLWADLLAKVEGGDPQVTRTIGWQSGHDVQRALRRVAQAAQSLPLQKETPSELFPSLHDCFGDKFDIIRGDLAEQRVVLDPTGENPRPSREHLILGYALHLGSLAAKPASNSVADLVEILRKELEPMTSQDQLTEALFVALQLSALPSGQGHSLNSRARAAFLYAWVSSQNSRVNPSRLEFWANEDLEAYLDFTEEVFSEPVSEGWLKVIMAPLVTLWRVSGPTHSTLDLRLRRWLKLIWKSHDLPKTPEFLHKGHSLPIAKTHSQLSLGIVAVAILSERPITSFLPDLAIAWATNDLSTDRHKLPNSQTGSNKEGEDIPCKSLDHNLGPLLRWCYTETVRSDLEALYASSPEDRVMLQGLSFMIEAFDKFGWRRFSVPEKKLREGQPLFDGTANTNEHRLWLTGCPELAIRYDWPELSVTDREIIVGQIQSTFNSPSLQSGYSTTAADLIMNHNLSWFARYVPDHLAVLGAAFRLRALDLKEIGPALAFANLLPLSADAVPAVALLGKAKEWADRESSASEPRWNLAVLHLHILAFTSLDESQLTEWLSFAGERQRLRYEIHLYPIPILSRLLISDRLAALARLKAKTCCAEQEDDLKTGRSEFEFWAALGGLAGPPDDDFHEWVTTQIQQTRPTEERRFYWLLLWFRTITDSALQQGLAHGSIFDFLAGDGWRAMSFAGRRIKDWSSLPSDFEQVLEKIPFDHAGTAFLNANRESDLTRWGRLLFDKALTLVGNPPFEPSFWGRTIYTVESSGEVGEASCDQEEDPIAERPQVLRPATAQVNGLRRAVSTEERERRANDGIRIWKKDHERLEKVEAGDFDRFNARRALKGWRDLNPDAFREYATILLEKTVSDPAKAFHMGGFIVAVVDALVPLDPDLAFETDRTLRLGALRVSSINDFGVPTFFAECWAAARNGNAKCKSLCLKVLKESKTDEELMSHAVTAQSEHAQEALLALCNDLLEAPLAKDRCLAISLLAWVPGVNEISRLNQIASRDPSGWVRNHAEWSKDVAEQEAAARNHYRQTLKEIDRNTVLARLQVLKPALTPAARWWHHELERESGIFKTGPFQIQAAVELFWYESANQCKRTPDLFGRKLNEYLRGERIRDLRTPKPRLVDEL